MSTDGGEVLTHDLRPLGPFETEPTRSSPHLFSNSSMAKMHHRNLIGGLIAVASAQYKICVLIVIASAPMFSHNKMLGSPGLELRRGKHLRLNATR
jgi:hypothetical protein